MSASDEDSYLKRSVVITFLWLVAMLVGGLLLINFGDALQRAFA